jgi:uncharacterized protein
VFFAALASTPMSAEKVADLPAPTGYVSDFAGVLNPATKQNLEALCTAVDRQAHAQVAVVTIKTLDDGQTIEEFSVQLEEKWKVGKKGTDEGLLMVVALNPRKIRVEVGYGLEGILNDAKVGAILDQIEPALRQNNFNQAIPQGVQALSQVIAANAGVTLGPVQHQYHRVPARSGISGIGQLVIVVGFILLVILLASTGNIGWLFVLLNMFMGGGGGGGRDDDDRGGGFGGFGGGSSGGGGASRDF